MVNLSTEDAKKLYFSIMRTNVIRDGVENMLKYLEDSDFFIAPASTRFHLSRPGGLCIHSLDVYYRLMKEISNEYGDVSKSPYKLDTLTIVSLCHDFCKIDMYETQMRNVKEGNTWVQKPKYVINDKLPIHHGYKSHYIVSAFIKLTREESIAIMHHMGGFDELVKGGSYSISNSFKMYPLAVLLHCADLKASNIDERGTEFGV